MENVFLTVLNMSFTGSFVIMVICLARLLLKRTPKSISYVLWAVVGFRLLFPFSIWSAFSLLPIRPLPIPRDIAMQAVPRIDSGIRVIDDVVSGSLPAAIPAASANPLQILIFLGAHLWLLGIAAMLLYSLVSLLRLKQVLRTGVNPKTPFVVGLFRPEIYLPAGLTDEERRYVLLHEETHIRRGDHIIKALAWVVLCLHWFNPLVWLAFTLMVADMEMSCDERVMRELGEEIKKAYSLSLVRVAAGHKILNGSPLAFGEGGMKERVKNVLNFKKPSRVIVTLAVVLAAALTIGLAVDRTDKPTRSSYQPRKWLDYYQDKDQMPWGRTEELALSGITFRWTPEKVTAMERDLFWGMPIWNVYLADLNADGQPELCATASFGSGIVDDRIVVYDYAADKLYELSDRGNYDYALFMENGRLMVKQMPYRQGYPDPNRAPLATGELAIVDGALSALGVDRKGSH